MNRPFQLFTWVAILFCVVVAVILSLYGKWLGVLICLVFAVFNCWHYLNTVDEERGTRG